MTDTGSAFPREQQRRAIGGREEMARGTGPGRDCPGCDSDAGQRRPQSAPPAAHLVAAARSAGEAGGWPTRLRQQSHPVLQSLSWDGSDAIGDAVGMCVPVVAGLRNLRGGEFAAEASVERSGGVEGSGGVELSATGGPAGAGSEQDGLVASCGPHEEVAWQEVSLLEEGSSAGIDIECEQTAPAQPKDICRRADSEQSLDSQENGAGDEYSCFVRRFEGQADSPFCGEVDGVAKGFDRGKKDDLTVSIGGATGKELCRPSWRSRSGYVHFAGEYLDTSFNKFLIQPMALVSKLAHARTPFQWVNILWLAVIANLTPAVFGLLWFGAIPISIGNIECRVEPFIQEEPSSSSDIDYDTGCDTAVIRRCVEGGFVDKAAWAFAVNPGTYVFFSFTLINMFLGCLDEARPWRPARSYMHILALGYIVQVGTAGASVMISESFSGLGLVALALSIAVTLLGLRFTPHTMFDTNRERFMKIYWSFVRLMMVFMIFWLLMLAYIIANANTESAGQGVLTFVLAIVTFIFKKILLAMTDVYPIEVAMVLSGLWLENLVDLFIVLAYPTVTRLGPTFAVILLVRVGEDLAYLGFQFDVWFKFRVWVKGVLGFTKKKSEPILEDVDQDDRGHSNQRPGYRRRQMRFLGWKLLSQLSSFIFFLVVIPALRFGQNQDFYPYSEKNVQIDFRGVLIDDAFKCFTKRQFKASMIVAFCSMGTFFVSGYLILLYMRKYNMDILEHLARKVKVLVVSHQYFGFVMTILISNVLLAVSSVQLYNRLFYF
ncbi:unnamed protein product [Ostreobium quekettii]|uniref:Transmembrane protein n=1 Tax=Ostreobium quekettii TaxID=121088 RepID=A0A8S1J722_9CHLO|nr:unnamed protein product [Ostreobium quekettii]